MATVSVTFDGSRISSADSETDGGVWDKLGATQPPVDETNFVLQGIQELSNKISSTTGGVQFDFASSIDFSTVPKTIIAKVQVSTVASIDTTVAEGMSYRFGVDDSNYYTYYLVGSGTEYNYPVNAGWWTAIIDPNVSVYRNETLGSVSLTAMDWIGLYVSTTALAKAENIVHSALDYVDNGEGLTLVGGDGVDVDGVFLDFVLEDEDVAAVAGVYDNRWRLAARSNGSDIVSDAIAVWTIGTTASAAVFTDSNKIVKWSGGRVNTGFHGLSFDLSNASSVITIESCTFISDGEKATNDSRADFNVIGGAGDASITGGSFINFNAFTLTSGIAIDSTSFVGPESLDQSEGMVTDCSFDSHTTASGTAFMSVSDITKVTGCSFTSGGTGYAITGFTTTTTYTLTNLNFSGYAASDGNTGNEAIYVEATSGTVTLNINGGTTPSVRTAGATVVKVSGAVNVTVKVTTTTGTDIQNARVFLPTNTGGSLPYNASVTITRSGATAIVSHTTHGMSTNDKVVINGANQQEYNGVYQITKIDGSSYSYTVDGSPDTPATGTITSSFVVLEGLTDIDGEITMSRAFPSDQPASGWARKSTSEPYYKTQVIVATIDYTSDLSLNVLLIIDE